MKEENDDVVKSVLGALRVYLHGKLPLDKDFFNELHSRGLLASNTARELAQLADQGKKDCVWKLVTYMEQFYTEEMLLRLCVFLEEYAQPARPKLATIASKIRQEISNHKAQPLPLPVPEDIPPLHRRQHGARVHDGEEALFPVITPLKQQFSELVSKVFVVINKLNEERMEELHSYLTTLLTDVRHARLPIVPKPVNELKEFLRVRWDELNIQVLESIVKHLNDDKLTEMMTYYQQTFSKEETASLSEYPAETVQIVITSDETLAQFKLDRNPDELTLARVFELRRLIHSLVAEPAVFRGFKRGCTVLFFSVPTECVWSLPSWLLRDSNLSLVEEWRVLFFSVKGAFTVNIKERRVRVDSLDESSETAKLTSPQPYWRQEPNAPEKMWRPTAVCVKDEIFVCARGVMYYTPHLHVFNVVTRSWSKLRYHESREMGGNTFATTNNQVHCLGGRWRKDGEEASYSQVVFTLDCGSLQWSDNTLPPLIIGRADATSTSFEGRLIVVAGGTVEDRRLSSVEVLNCSQQSSTWWKICDLPVESSYMKCTVSDTELFVGCGVGIERTIYSCNLSAVKEAMVPGDSTSPESFWHSLPETALNRSGLAVVNNCLVAVGGYDNVVRSSAVHVYDNCKNTWSKVSDLNKSRHSPAVVFCSFENKHDLFVLGGSGAPTSVESCL